MASSIRHLMAAGALTVATMMPGATAYAQSPFDFFFGPPRQWVPRYYDRRDYGYGRDRHLADALAKTEAVRRAG